MKKLAVTSAVALMLASTAFAQTTIDTGAMSNLEKQVIDVLLAHGVPASIVGSLTMNQIAQIKGVMDSSDPQPQKEQRVKAIIGWN